MNVTIEDSGLTEAKEVLNPEEAMGQFKKMKDEMEHVVLRVESFQQMARRFVEEASETLSMNTLKGEALVAGVQRLVDSPEGPKNLLPRALIQLMNEDLSWFKKEAVRVAKIKKHYTEMSQLYL